MLIKKKIPVMNVNKVSVIIPCYNEEEIILNTLNKVIEFLKTHKNYKFVFVDDGSTDNTTKIFEKENIMTNDRLSKMSLISYEKNRGKGYAISKGVACADGDYICFLDSDLAYSLEHLPLLVEKLKNNDIAIGNRGLVAENNKNISRLRILFGIIFNFFIQVILNLRFNDTQAGLKSVTKIIAKDLFNNITMDGWSFDTELLFIAKKRGYKIAEIPAKVSENHLSKNSKIKLIRDSTIMFLDLVKIRINNWLGKYDKKR